MYLADDASRRVVSGSVQRGLSASALLLAALTAFAPPQFTLAASVVGTGIPSSCTEAALDAALASGGTITFNCGPNALVITVTNPKTFVSNDTSAPTPFGVGGRGGAIFNSGTLHVTSSYFSGNVAASGGGIYDVSNLTTPEAPGTLNVAHSRFVSNLATAAGGAISTTFGALNVIDSTFQSNRAGGGGGAIINSGKLTLSGSTSWFNDTSGVGRNGNPWGGAVLNYGELSVTRTFTPTPPCATTCSRGTCDAGGICAVNSDCFSGLCNFLGSSCCSAADCGLDGVCGTGGSACAGVSSGVCPARRCIVGDAALLGTACSQGGNCGVNGWCSELCNVSTPPCLSGSCSTLVPLTDLSGQYRGASGGLYPVGGLCLTPPCNARPPGSWADEGQALANQMQRLDAAGNPSTAGHYILLSMGYSNVTAEFEQGFMPLADADATKDPGLVIVDGAQSSAVASHWADDAGTCTGGIRDTARCHTSTPVTDTVDGCPGGTCTGGTNGAGNWDIALARIRTAGVCTGGGAGTGDFCSCDSGLGKCPNAGKVCPPTAPTCSPLGLTPEQVTVMWIKESNFSQPLAYPCSTSLCPTCTAGTLCDSQVLSNDIRKILHIAMLRYPNLKLVYFSSRIYGGYATTQINPEPYAYQGAFAYKTLIEKQIVGRGNNFSTDPNLDYRTKRCQAGPNATCTSDADCGGRPQSCRVLAPWIAWGPYLWANGTSVRGSDGLAYLDSLSYPCSDFGVGCTDCDGTHPGAVVKGKVGQQLLDFVRTDETAQQWYLAAPPAATSTFTLIPTVTQTATPTNTASASPTNVQTQTPTQTPTTAPTATNTTTNTKTGTATPVATGTPTHTVPPTFTPRPCVGDCDGLNGVTVGDIITLVNIALGNPQASACPHGVPSGAEVNVALIIQAVNSALSGCSG